MKQKLLLLATTFLLLAFQTQAQNTAKVTGHVNDQSGNGIKSATVMLYRAADSVLVKTEVTDASGDFEIAQVKAGKYYLLTSFVGFQKNLSASFTVAEGQTVNIPAYQLKEADKSLTGVTVSSTYKKPLIEVKADKTVFNVESSINATGSNAFELLQKSPGVVTDKDDNISLKGKNGVRVYIDNRPVQMSGADLAAYLRSINSADIEAIEMITNPSAKYDAAGNAGIINIKFKKNKKYGTNGSFTQGFAVGKTPKTNQALSLNYRNKKVNLFSNYSNSWGENEFNFFLNRKQLDSMYDQSSVQVSKGWNHNIKAGIDIFATKEQTIGFIITGNSTDNTGNTQSRTPISSLNTGKLGQILYAKNTLPGTNKNLNFNFNYRFADSTGHEFTLDANHGFFRNRKTSYQPNAYYTPYPETLSYEKNYRNSTPTDININTVQLDYESPFKKGVLGLGIKLSDVKTDNTFDFYNVIGGNDNIDLNRSNTFSYKENVNAAYVNYNRKLNAKWGVQGGVRMENTISDGELRRADGQQQADNSVKRNYTDFFPSAAISFTPNMSNALNLTYSRRIDRPSYQDLNPFENKLDELTYQKGNAFLRAQYTNSIELAHTFKYRYTTTLGYSHISDFRAQVIDTTEGSKSYISQKNLASQDLYNINFSLPFQVTKWWSIYANINAYHSYYKADFGGGKTVNLKVNSGNIYVQQSFTLGDGYTGEISGFYTAPSVWAGTFKSNALGTLDLGLQKTLFKGKGTVKFSYTDLLKTLHWAGSSEYGGSNIRVSGNWESQQLKMNFTYRFGNNQVKAARQRKLSAEEETKRTQSNTGGFGN